MQLLMWTNVLTKKQLENQVNSPLQFFNRIHMCMFSRSTTFTSASRRQERRRRDRSCQTSRWQTKSGHDVGVCNVKLEMEMDDDEKRMEF